jgi:multiple sugar transport system ATP-binding protein
MTLADKIVVLRDGGVEQVGSPMALYNGPANQFVAGFLGAPSMNFLPAIVENGSADTTNGVRPEHIRLSETGRLRAIVSHVENLGGDTNVLVELADGTQMTVRLFGQHNVAPEEAVSIDFDDSDTFLFGASGERLRDSTVLATDALQT